MDLLSKLKFILRKPRLIVAVGSGRASDKEAILQVLKQYPRTAGNILVSESDLKSPQDAEELKFLIHNSSLFVLALSHVEGTTEKIQNLSKITPTQAWFVLNSDEDAVRETVNDTDWKILTFGFQEKSDIRATDVNVNGGTNFKINYKGSTVPVWLEQSLAREEIYPVLAGVCVGIIFGLNLIEISRALKNYRF